MVGKKDRKSKGVGNTMKVNEQLSDPIINDEELVVVIAAAIAASLGVSVPEANIKSIKRVVEPTNVWSIVGRQEQMSSRL